MSSPPPRTPHGPAPGDRAPAFYGMRADGRFHSSEDQAGRAAVLILAARLAPEALAPLLDVFADQAVRLQRLACDALVLVSADPLWTCARTPRGGPAIVHCPSDMTFVEAGVDGARPLVLVVDRGGRIVARLEGDPQTAVRKAMRALAALPREASAGVSVPAPILVVPDLVDHDLRTRLIARFEDGPHAEGTMASTDARGLAMNRLDGAKKRRRDAALDPGSDLHGEVVDALDRRLLPEIRRAFQAEVAHVDRILIARYDAGAGFFRRHRDNTAPQVAFRQFALSLNLNTGDYDGGELAFPEYNDHRYNPPAGSACVFSASLLHEALPVTRGRRYVLLTFLHDDRAEARRQRQLAEAARLEAAA